MTHFSCKFGLPPTRKALRMDRCSKLNVALNLGMLNRIELNHRSDQGCLCSFKSLKERRTHSRRLFNGLSVLMTVHSCSFTNALASLLCRCLFALPSLLFPPQKHYVSRSSLSAHQCVKNVS